MRLRRARIDGLSVDGQGGDGQVHGPVRDAGQLGRGRRDLAQQGGGARANVELAAEFGGLGLFGKVAPKTDGEPQAKTPFGEGRLSSS